MPSGASSFSGSMYSGSPSRIPTTNIFWKSPRFCASRTNASQSEPNSETYSASGFFGEVPPLLPLPDNREPVRAEQRDVERVGILGEDSAHLGGGVDLPERRP